MATASAKLLKRLLEPLDVPYDTPRVLERVTALSELHEMAEAQEALAVALTEITRRSFWAHLALLAWTHDEKDELLRVKPFSPIKVYKTLADWFDERDPLTGRWAHPTIAIKKSRQLMISWLCMARMDWCCIHNQQAFTFVLSEDIIKASKQVERVKTLHEHYPPWFRSATGMDGVKLLTKGVVYPNSSFVMSVPQASGRAAASYVPTMGFSDEAAHQEYFEKNWTAIKGGTDSRSQIFAVSSVNPSAFMGLVNDTMDGAKGGRARTLHESQGLSLWVNRLNGVACASVHYTADPARRSEAWKAQSFAGYGGKWQWEQEQEMREDVRGGRPIFRMLDRTVHVTAGHIDVFPIRVRGGYEWRMRIEGRNDERGNPIVAPVRLLRATDHGTSGYGACVWVAVDDDFDWFVYRTYKVTGRFAPQHAASIAALSYRDEIDAYEHYSIDCIDAMQGLPDQMGKVEDIYRAFKDKQGHRPLAGMVPVQKGAGSRQHGLDSIAAMLHSTLLAVAGPDHAYWREEGYEDYHLRAIIEHSSLYLGRDVAEPLFNELEKARWDEARSADPEFERPETSLNMMDDATDCLRYLTISGEHLIRQVHGITMTGAR